MEQDLRQPAWDLLDEVQELGSAENLALSIVKWLGGDGCEDLLEWARLNEWPVDYVEERDNANRDPHKYVEAAVDVYERFGHVPFIEDVFQYFWSSDSANEFAADYRHHHFF